MIHLIGAGGHGRVVADALVASGIDSRIIVVRDGREGLMMLGRLVATPELTPAIAGESFHVAIGTAAIRACLHKTAIAYGARPISVVHPAATVSPEAVLGDAAFVAANAVVAPGAAVGNGSIINHGAIVDHDCRIGIFCHLAPNVTLGGEVTISDGVIIGAGAVVLPGVSIGSGVIVGAGAVVLRTISEPGTWVGTPARRLAR